MSEPVLPCPCCTGIITPGQKQWLLLCVACAEKWTRMQDCDHERETAQAS